MRLRTTAALLLTALVLAGCGGGSSDESAGDLLARAKTTLDDAASVHFVLTSDGAPAGGNALLGGEGDIARAGVLQRHAAGAGLRQLHRRGGHLGRRHGVRPAAADHRLQRGRPGPPSASATPAR